LTRYIIIMLHLMKLLASCDDSLSRGCDRLRLLLQIFTAMTMANGQAEDTLTLNIVLTYVPVPNVLTVAED
jgi:hypothetical protein